MGCGGKDPTFPTAQGHPPSHPLAMSKRPSPLLSYTQTLCHCPHSLLHPSSHTLLLYTHISCAPLITQTHPSPSHLQPPHPSPCCPQKSDLLPGLQQANNYTCETLVYFRAAQPWVLGGVPQSKHTNYQNLIQFIHFSKQENWCYKLQVT